MNHYQFQFCVQLEDDESATELRKEIITYINSKVAAWVVPNAKEGVVYGLDENAKLLMLVARRAWVNL